MRILVLIAAILASGSALSMCTASSIAPAAGSRTAGSHEPCLGFFGDRVIVLRGEGSQEEGATRKLASLSVGEVCILMFNMGINPTLRPRLGKHEALAQSGLPVNGALLADVDEEGLRKLGMTGMHRKELLHRIKEFRAGGVPHDLVESKDIGLVIRRMETHECEGSTHVQALRYIAENGAENRVQIVAKGGVEAIVKALQTHGWSEQVQEQGCWALCRLAVGAENEVAIAAKGGIEAVMGAMQQHGTSEGVQVAGCRALWGLAFNAENKVAAKGGIEVVMGAMRDHEWSSAVQEHGCRALRNLARDQQNQVAIAAKGGIEAVISAMAAHWSSVGVQEAGCGALFYLAENEENRVMIAAKGGIEAVVWAMGAHKLKGGVQVKGCLALKQLAMNPENKLVIAAEGGIEAVVRAMGNHGSSTLLQEQGCWALENIAESDVRLQSQVREAGAVPFVEKALLRFPDKGDLQQHGKGLLEKLGTC